MAKRMPWEPIRDFYKRIAVRTRRMRNSFQPWGWQALERQWTWCGHLVRFPPSRLARVVASSFDDGMRKTLKSLHPNSRLDTGRSQYFAWRWDSRILKILPAHPHELSYLDANHRSREYFKARVQDFLVANLPRGPQRGLDFEADVLA